MDYWQIKNGKLFESFKKDIKDHYPTLNILVLNNIVFLKGTIRIKDTEDIILDSFKIEIEIPHNFPQEIPWVKEIGNRIPILKDRHFEENGNRACLCFRDEIFLYWSEKSTILDFMEIFVKSFFLWQIEYEITGGQNQDKASPHGIDGAFYFYKRISETNDINAVHKFIEYLTKKKIKRHWNCYCGSRKEIRNCHLKLIMKYKSKIRIKDAKKTLNDFNKIINKVT